MGARTAFDGMLASLLTSLSDATMSRRPRGGWEEAGWYCADERCSGGRSSSSMTSVCPCARRARAWPMRTCAGASGRSYLVQQVRMEGEDGWHGAGQSRRPPSSSSTVAATGDMGTSSCPWMRLQTVNWHVSFVPWLVRKIRGVSGSRWGEGLAEICSNLVELDSDLGRVQFCPPGVRQNS